MKLLLITMLVLLLFSGCSGNTEDNPKPNGPVMDADGRVLLDNVYACEKIVGLGDGGNYRIASADGKLYFSGWNEESYDVFSYDGTSLTGIEYGLERIPYGIGAADGGLALIATEWDRDRGERMMLYFANPDSGELYGGIDFTSALPGISEEIEMNGMPDFVVGRIPGGAAVSDGKNVALVYRDGSSETLSLPGSIMSVTADRDGELCLYLVNAVAERSVYSLHSGELDPVSDDIPEIKSSGVYKTENGLLMLTESGFCRVTDTGAELILNFEHSSLVWSEEYHFCVVSEDEIYYSGINDITKDNGLYRLTHAEDQYRHVIEVLNFSDEALDTFAMLFNASQSEYFVIGARPQYGRSDTPDAILNEFDKKLISGDCGDLVCLDSRFDWENYAAQGIFADLSGIFDEGELFDCVTDALMRDGKLYTVCRSFSLRTLYTLDEYWNDREMTPAELIGYASSLGEDSRLFWSMSAANVQSILLSGMGSYLGSEDGFSCPSFTDSLGYIDRMPEVFDTVGLSSGADAYVSGSVKFMLANVFSLETWLDMHRFEADGMQFAETGYPTPEGGRSVLQPFEFYAVPENAREREGAEEFLRFVLNCHTRMGDMGIPADVTAFRDKMQAAKEFFFEYEPGRIGFMFAGRAEDYDPGNENHEPVTDGCIAEFEQWLMSRKCTTPLPLELESIIGEEIGAYLKGLCTAEECAERIDSRTGIYLSERN